MLVLLTIANSLAFAGYCYLAWYLTSPHFIEAFYVNITGERYGRHSS
jgi:hypothetical protein